MSTSATPAPGATIPSARASPSSPRRATVALQSAPAVSTATATAATVATHARSSLSTIYDRQMMWKTHGQRKLEYRSQELLLEADQACTFAPRINKTTTTMTTTYRPKPQSSMATDALSPCSTRIGASTHDSSSSQSSQSPRSVGVSMGRVTIGQQYYQPPQQPLGQDGEREHNDSVYGDANDGRVAPCEGTIPDSAGLYPTESQEQSIQLFIARQARAREAANRAHHRLLSTQPAKDFSRVTAPRPFDLSVTNRKPRRASSASPTDRTSGSQERTKPSARRRPQTTTPTVAATGDTSSPPRLHALDVDGPDQSHSVDADTTFWQAERDSLLEIIDAQRRELAERDRVRDEASKIAETFAAAVQAFEERVEAIERTTATELGELKALVTRQAASTDIILSALGLAPVAAPVSGAPVSPVSSTTTTTTRRDTK